MKKIWELAPKKAFLEKNSPHRRRHTVMGVYGGWWRRGSERVEQLQVFFEEKNGGNGSERGSGRPAQKKFGNPRYTRLEF